MNAFKILFAVYGLGVSAVSAYGVFALDMPALEHAVLSGSARAEQRHRTNVAAEGTWLLLGNLITVCSIVAVPFRHDSKDGQA